jgi:hypothetical protein
MSAYSNPKEPMGFNIQRETVWSNALPGSETQTFGPQAATTGRCHRLSVIFVPPSFVSFTRDDKAYVRNHPGLVRHLVGGEQSLACSRVPGPRALPFVVDAHSPRSRAHTSDSSSMLWYLPMMMNTNRNSCVERLVSTCSSAFLAVPKRLSYP